MFIKKLLLFVFRFKFFFKIIKFIHRNLKSTKNFHSNQIKFQEYLDELFTQYKPVKIIQVGSNDGVSNDPLRAYISRSKTNTILIEPVPFICNSLKLLYEKNPEIIILNIAIGSDICYRNFYFISNDALPKIGNYIPSWMLQIGSFDRFHVNKHFFGFLDEFISSINILTLPLSIIVKDYIFEDLDLLHIDAEGSDYEVFKSLNFPLIKPKIIIIEHKHMSEVILSELTLSLVKEKYKITYFDDDLVAVR